MAKDYLFLDDINSKKMIFAHLIRSTIPKGTISSIKIPKLPKGDRHGDQSRVVRYPSLPKV